MPGARWAETTACLERVRQGARAPLRFPDIESKTTLSPYPQSVSAARRFVRDVLMSRHVSDQVVHVVELLTSEVVTNAIVHARSSPQLVVRLVTGHVRVEVHDVSRELPVRRYPDPLTPFGRGLAIVEELSHRWGVEHMPRGKRVWFEVPFVYTSVPEWTWQRHTS